MKAEEDELEAALALALASGTAYYGLDTENYSIFPVTDTPQTLSEEFSVNGTALPTVPAHPSSVPDVPSDPNPSVRIIKPLPKRDLRSRVPNAPSAPKPPRLIKPLPKRMSKVHARSAENLMVQVDPTETTTNVESAHESNDSEQVGASNKS